MTEIKIGTRFRFADSKTVYRVTFVTDDGYYFMYENAEGWRDIMAVESLEEKLRTKEVVLI